MFLINNHLKIVWLRINKGPGLILIGIKINFNPKELYIQLHITIFKSEKIKTAES